MTLAETTHTITPRADVTPAEVSPAEVSPAEVSLAGMRLDLAEAARAASERD
jgi:hypothetical protein